jgi:hypothetical protein
MLFNHGVIWIRTRSPAYVAALKKESQDRLKAYQHLFYLLQTDPDYLARWDISRC